MRWATTLLCDHSSLVEAAEPKCALEAALWRQAVQAKQEKIDTRDVKAKYNDVSQKVAAREKLHQKVESAKQSLEVARRQHDVALSAPSDVRTKVASLVAQSRDKLRRMQETLPTRDVVPRRVLSVDQLARLEANKAKAVERRAAKCPRVE